MNAASMVVVLAVVGVNFGWHPAEDEPDGYEFVVQIEPELLDVLQRGEKVPIESKVPAHVAPIRKVSIVVGRGDLPREALTGVNRTAYFAGQPAWTPDRYTGVAPAAATTTDDRYGPPPAFGNRSAVAPPPSVLDRAQTAVTETGNTLREGLEAGIQAANEQLYRSGQDVRDSALNAGQQFGQQLGEWTHDPQQQLENAGNNLRNTAQQTLGTVSNQLQQVTNPFATTGSQAPASNRAKSSVAPPPWPVAGSTAAPTWTDNTAIVSRSTPGPTASPSTFAPKRTPSGWTSIDANVAAPPLVTPSLGMASRANAEASPRDTSNNGPMFPNSTAATRQPLHSPLVDPTDDWSAGWDNAAIATQATIERPADANPSGRAARTSDLVQVQPPPSTGQKQQTQQPSNGWSDGWPDGDLWSQPAQTTPSNTTAQNSAALPATTASQPAANATNAGGNNNPPPTSNVGVIPQTPLAAAADQPPWLPLLVVSLSLMGSLGANLFLGWSYMDARQKYRSLVQKTADTFRRGKTAAA